MDFNETVELIARGNWLADNVNRGGKVLASIGAIGWFTTANVWWLVCSLGSVAGVAAQVWWGWYAAGRRARIGIEADKARTKKQLQSEGIDTADIPMLQYSPDPDSETEP